MSICAITLMYREAFNSLPCWLAGSERELGITAETVRSVNATRVRALNQMLRDFMPRLSGFSGMEGRVQQPNIRQRRTGRWRMTETIKQQVHSYCVGVLHRYMWDNYARIPLYPVWVRATRRASPHSDVAYPPWFPTLGHTYLGPGY